MHRKHLILISCTDTVRTKSYMITRVLESFGQRRRKGRKRKKLPPRNNPQHAVSAADLFLKIGTKIQFLYESYLLRLHLHGSITTNFQFSFLNRFFAPPVRCVVITHNSSTIIAPAANSRNLFNTRSGFPRCAQRRSQPEPADALNRERQFSRFF
jgi:hypothetical protein